MTGLERVAVVTGAAGGIGAAVSRAFLAAGWSVVGVDVRTSDGAGGLRSETVDVADPQAMAELFARVGAREGRVDALVNNAAVQLCLPIDQIDAGQWDATMAVNVRGAFLAVRHALPHMAPGSSIVNVSSVHAVASSIHMSAYAASKGALSAMTRALAVELAPRGVRVNAVLPGAVDTPMLRAGLTRGHLGEAGGEDELIAALGRRHPLGRVGAAEEVARLVVFLADGDASGFLTGGCFRCDGGALARLSTE